MNAQLTPGTGLRVAVPRLALGALVLAGYAGVAHSVQQLYPFSIFDMYAHRAQSASRVVARDAAGGLSEVTAWRGWRCAPAPAVTEPGTVPAYSVPYRDREAAAWVRDHPLAGAAGGEAVDVVRHIWWLQPAPGQPASEDRPLWHCQAVRQ